ncbi:MAG: ABC-type multidrug transport system, ATPase and permease component [Rickettsiaceae bacterium]|jgi:ATP-binding cassette subfamily C protein|nr:ABC-type multidrug transport system, ATPase and permease component [Rickettsiaceae bacterium]
MIRLFLSFLSRFGTNRRAKLLYLTLLALIAGAMELVGISLIFPLIALINNPNVIIENQYLRVVFNILNFSDTRYFTVFIACSIGVIFVLKNAYSLFYQNAQYKFITDWKNDICKQLMRGYLSKPYTFFLTKNSSELINMLSNIVYFVLDGFILQAIIIITHLVVGSVIILFLLKQYLVPTLVSATLLAILIKLQNFYLKNYIKKISQEYSKLRLENYHVLQQSIGAIKETKMHLKEEYFLNVYDKVNKKVSASDKDLIFLRYLPTSTTEILLIFTIILMACLLLFRPDMEGAKVEDLAVLAAVAFRLAPIVNRSLASLSQMSASRDSVNLMLQEELFSVPITYSQDYMKIIIKERISFKDIFFTYPGKKVPSLNNINLTINKGEFIGIIGHSGAGKTTLIDVLTGLLPQDSGEIYLDEVKLNQQNIRGFRANIGYVNQNIFIMDATVRENVAFRVPYKDIDDAKVIEALKKAELYEYFELLPDKLNTQLGENGKNLSGGQKQRISIARALYHDPQIIILDEATSALDLETENNIIKIINALKGDKTIIAVAHRLSTLKAADRLIYMKNGTIIDVGTFNELEEKHSDFKDLLKLSDFRNNG